MTALSKKLSQDMIDTDVLIIGAGAGGMMAAITAADVGVSVTLCEKGNARRSGGIYSGNDHFMCHIPEIHGHALLEQYIKQRLNSELLDEDTLRKQLGLTYEAVKKWESWGIKMKTNGHYEFTGHGWPGSSGKMGVPGKTDRMFLHFSDNQACVKLEKQVRDRGVRIMNRVMVTELLKNANGRVTGAVGISTREPIQYVIRAKSIVINQGGVDRDRLYASPHIITYNTAIPGTGDGIIMAYRAGAAVQNAEFCYRQVAQRFGPTTGKGTWVGVARDNEGNPIAPPYLSKPDAEIGDMAIENADALDHVLETGRGPVWMDSRGISDEEERYMIWGFESEAMIPFLKWLEQEKIDVKKSRFEFVPLQPSTRIQIRSDFNAKSSLDGCYAVMRGNLPVSTVGGMIAGESAASDAQTGKLYDLSKNHDDIFLFKQRYEDLLNRDGLQFAHWREAQWAIYQIMHCYALPPSRTEATLKAGYTQLQKVKKKAHKILKASNQNELYHCLEVFNLMEIAELVILAVNERKESRSQARRQDFPFTNPMLNKFLVMTQKDGKPVFNWEKPRRMSNKA